MPAVTIQHAKTVTITDWSGTITVGNSTGGTATAAASDLARPSDWNSSHSATIQMSASDIAGLFVVGSGLTSATAAGGISIGGGDPNYFEPFPMPNTNSTLSTMAVGSWYFDPVFLPDGLDGGRINLFRTQNASIFLNGVTITYNVTASVSKVASFRNCIAFYKRGAGAQSTRLESLWTGANELSATYTAQWSSVAANSTNAVMTAGLTIGFNTQINTSGGDTTSQFTITGTTNQSSSSMAAGTMDGALSSNSSAKAFFTGSMMDMIPFNTTLPPGNYWLAHMFTTHSSGTTAGRDMASAGTMFFTSSVAHLNLLENALSGFKQLGFSTVGNSTSCGVPFHGALATTTSNASSVVATSDLRVAAGRLYWNYIQDQVG